MVKEVKAVFKLTDKEIKEALYDYYVRKLKSNNINAVFSEQDIFLDEEVEVSLTIIENKQLD